MSPDPTGFRVREWERAEAGARAMQVLYWWETLAAGGGPRRAPAYAAHRAASTERPTMRMLRGPALSTLTALALCLTALPAMGQAGSPVLAPAAGEWDRYLSTAAPAEGAAAEPGAGARLWYRFGIGATALGATGVFSYYVKHDFFAPYPPVTPEGTRPPAAPGIRDPGPAASKPGKPGGTGGETDPPPTPPRDGAGTVPDSTSISPPDLPPDGGVITGPQPPKTVPIPPSDPGDDVPTTVTPEPSTLVLLMSGMLAFLFLKKRRTA